MTGPPIFRDYVNVIDFGSMGDLSKKIGQILCVFNRQNSIVLLGSECGGTERVSFFLEDANRENSFVWVDAAISVNGEIKVVIEIEESKFTPTHFCGKVLATAISNFYEGKRGHIPLSLGILFIQVFVREYGEPLPDGTKVDKGSKKDQCGNLQNQISGILPPDRTRIARYSIHWGTVEEFKNEPNHAAELVNEIEQFLSV